MNELNEQTTIRLPVGVAWGLSAGLVGAAFWLGMGYFELRQMARKMDKIEDHDKRLIRIETKLGLSHHAPHTNSAVLYSSRGDL
jgi:hypothetical protein